MNVTCNVIGDLLPLYVEELASEDSIVLVEEHLTGCSACRERAKAISAYKTPEYRDLDNLPKLQKRLSQRRKTAALFALFFTAAILLCAWAYLMSPVYLTAEEADIQLFYGANDAIVYYMGEDGCIALQPYDSIPSQKGILTLYCSDMVRSVTQSRVVDPDSGEVYVTITATCRRMDLLYPREPADAVIVTLEADFTRLYYASLDGREDTLLWWSKGNPSDGGVQTLPRLVLGYYLLLAAGSGILLLIIGAVLRKKRAGKYMLAAGCWCLCLALSLVLVSGGKWPVADSADVPWMLISAVVLALVMTAALLFGRKTWKLSREER